MSQGEYIQWFDSDDLMVAEKLELKVKAMLENEVDLVVSNTINFYDDGSISRPYKLDYTTSINPENYISQRIGWITNDALIKKSFIKILFHEKLKSGQEYNFFSRLLFFEPKVYSLKADLSKRRMHNNTIQKKLKKNHLEQKKELIVNEILLMSDVYDYSSSKIKNRSLKRIFRFSLETTPKHKLPNHYFIVNSFFLKNYLLKIILFYNIWVIFNLLTGKGYFIFQKYSKIYE
jgi:hypothetical protein